jgi:hypothetical protein
VDDFAVPVEGLRESPSRRGEEALVLEMYRKVTNDVVWVVSGFLCAVEFRLFWC